VSYQEGFDEGLQYTIDLLEDLLYENEGETFIEFSTVKDLLNEIYKAKTN